MQSDGQMNQIFCLYWLVCILPLCAGLFAVFLSSACFRCSTFCILDIQPCISLSTFDILLQTCIPHWLWMLSCSCTVHLRNLWIWLHLLALPLSPPWMLVLGWGTCGRMCLLAATSSRICLKVFLLLRASVDVSVFVVSIDWLQCKRTTPSYVFSFSLPFRLPSLL